MFFVTQLRSGGGEWATLRPARPGAATVDAAFASPIIGEGVMLRAPLRRDHRQWAQLRERSRAFLTPWEPLWAADELTPAAFRRRLRRYEDDRQSGRALPLLIFDARGRNLLGGLTFSQIHRGVVQQASLGYWMGEDHAGQGHMKRALRAAIAHGFGPLALHRLHAACQPHNVRSRGLLKSLGFQEEGFAPSYLFINGGWRDHVLYGLVNPAG